MYDVGGACRSELEKLLQRHGMTPADWWAQVPEVFEPELSHPTQVQVRLDSGFAALILRSHFGSLRTRCYHLLAERSLSFTVASACERISRRHPEDAWMLKLAISGAEPYAKLYFDRRLTLQELEPIATDLGLSTKSVMAAAEKLLEATGADRLRCISVAPGGPVRVELYASCHGELGGDRDTLQALADLTRASYDPSFEALAAAHTSLSGRGRQRYSIGLDGRGVREGLKAGYTDMSESTLAKAIELLTPAPLIAQRRLRTAREVLGSETVDHLSVRLRPGRPIHVTTYFNRTWAGVA